MNPARVLLFACMGIMLCLEVLGAERKVVLVAGATSPLHDLDSLELRKIYLGFPVKRDGHTVSGVRNTGDEDLNRIFLQSVVAMSEKSYLRRLLSLPLRHGTPRPSEYGRPRRLLDALLSDPYSVTYMWKDTAALSPDVKTLRVLWQQD